jgi:hypothetical protein
MYHKNKLTISYNLMKKLSFRKYPCSLKAFFIAVLFGITALSVQAQTGNGTLDNISYTYSITSTFAGSAICRQVTQAQFGITTEGNIYRNLII